MKQLAVFLDLRLYGTVFAEKFDHILQIGMGLAQLAKLVLIRIDVRIGKGFLQFHVFLFQTFEFGKHVYPPTSSPGAGQAKKPAIVSWALCLKALVSASSLARFLCEITS